MNPIIEITNLGKRYRIGAQREPYLSLRDEFAKPFRRLSSMFSHLTVSPSTDAPTHRPPSTDSLSPVSPSPVSPPTAHRLPSTDFWALKDVSFSVNQGEAVGIIGRNGAGKSTLLKILSQITPPTEGKITCRGRIASLLEVGTGFHPELTGRENIFLNGAILGMTRAEIRRKFDEIVAFAEVEQFLDTPVKRYSSGMYVRLAFAVAAHLEPEILVVDEVLAVGDSEFQKKCLGKMQEVSHGGRTVLFVSHNLNAIRTLCNRVLVLDKGRGSFLGDVSDGISRYSAATKQASALMWLRTDNHKESVLGFEAIRVVLEGEQPRMILRCELLMRAKRTCPSAFVAVDILDSSLTPIMQAVPIAKPFLSGSKGLHEVVIEIELPPLIPGQYLLDCWVGSHYTETCDCVQQAISFEVIASPTNDRSFPHSATHGFLVPLSRCTYRTPTEADEDD